MKTISKQNLRGEGLLPTTHWSVILRAGDGSSPDAQQALETLCRAYWYPLYAYLRRQGRDAPAAEDLTQGFFAHLLDKERLRTVQQREGMRFRSWLLTSLRHYVTSEWRRGYAQRRGGGQSPISIDADEAEQRYHDEPADPTDPEKLFERKWAMELLNRVLTLLKNNYASKGKQALFAELSPFIMGGDDLASQRDIGKRLGMAASHVGVAVSRLRHRYHELLRAEIAHTVATREEIEDELRHLCSTISQ
jgi:RNA polymerase sigma factor (sigma-70 family)